MWADNKLDLAQFGNAYVSRLCNISTEDCGAPISAW